jgi:hypothetical protein
MDERRRLERQRIDEEREAAEAAGTTPPDGSLNTSGRISPVEKPSVSVPTGPMPEVDRGLCVVCQDEEATLAVVDCG